MNVPFDPAISTIRPTFINVGPGRSGTSWLLNMLRAHPEIAMARVKETEYFNTHFDAGRAWYLSHFAEPGRAVGEISNMYYVDTNVASRVRDFDPSMKIIFNVRRPIDLLESMAGFGVRRGMEPADPMLLSVPIGQLMGSGFDARVSAGMATSGDLVPLSEAVMLSGFIRPFIDVFPASQIYFLIYDQIATEPNKLLSELYGFLGVDPTIVPAGAAEVVNPAMTPRLRLVGALATRVSFFLRRIGAYGILGRLHRSEVLKKLLFRSPVKTEASRALPPLPQSLRDGLAAEEARLIEIIPDLKRFWAAGDLRPETNFPGGR